jgi:hypothetical protein
MIVVQRSLIRLFRQWLCHAEAIMRAFARSSGQPAGFLKTAIAVDAGGMARALAALMHAISGGIKVRPTANM